MSWTRIYNAHDDSSESSQKNVFQMLSHTKPCGVYLSLDDAWLKECGRETPWGSNYTHAKVLLNPQDFKVLRLTPENIDCYVTTLSKNTPFERTVCQWEYIWQLGFDGVHITSQLLDAAIVDEKMDLQFAVETLIIWRKREILRWSHPYVV